MSIYSELKRRNVFRVAAAYLAGAWLLVEVSETLFSIYGLPGTAARIVVTLLVIGFPITLVLSWVYELTPEGLKLEKDIDRAGPAPRSDTRRLDRAIIVLLALALGYFAVDKFVLEPGRVAEIVEETAQQARSEALVESYGEKSIAVLPFVNMSADSEQEYFSDGMSEELLVLLSRVPGLRVISRSSSFLYKGRDVDIPTIARQLNVSHVLEGSVRKDGGQVRITAQLIEGRSDSHIWSATYDREFKNLFGLQNEISDEIAKALKISLHLENEDLPETSPAPPDEAHDAYLRGRYLLVQRTPASVEAAVRQFKKAVQLDPDYAVAHAELAISILLALAYIPGEFERSETIARATPHAERALSLAPTLAEAHAAMGFLHLYEFQYETALAYFRESIRINPNYAIVYSWMGNVLRFRGKYKESFSLRETELKIDPLSKVAIMNYIEELCERDLLETAERELEKIREIYPDAYAWLMGIVKSAGGQWSYQALGYLDSLLINPDSGQVRIGFALMLALMDMEAEAHAIAGASGYGLGQIFGKPAEDVEIAEAELTENPDWPAARRNLGFAYACTGDYDRARPLLEEYWRENSSVAWGIMHVDVAVALLVMREAVDDEAGRNEILAAIEEDVRGYREAGINRSTWSDSANYEEGIAAVIKGEDERGLDLIARAVDDGFYILPYVAFLKFLYEKPRFAAIMETQQARRERERTRFLSVVCNENPYAQVWQPLLETCQAVEKRKE